MKLWQSTLIDLGITFIGVFLLIWWILELIAIPDGQQVLINWTPPFVYLCCAVVGAVFLVYDLIRISEGEKEDGTIQRI